VPSRIAAPSDLEWDHFYAIVAGWVAAVSVAVAAVLKTRNIDLLGIAMTVTAGAAGWGARMTYWHSSRGRSELDHRAEDDLL